MLCVVFKDKCSGYGFEVSGEVGLAFELVVQGSGFGV
jgi:hypothetical protein